MMKRIRRANGRRERHVGDGRKLTLRAERELWVANLTYQVLTQSLLDRPPDTRERVTEFVVFPRNPTPRSKLASIHS